MSKEINDSINYLTIDCPDCEYMGSDDQYTCTTCWCEGGNGRINIISYLKDNPNSLVEIIGKDNLIQIMRDIKLSQLV